MIAALRQATADRHRSLETLLALDSPLDLGRYRRVLQGFGVFLAAWEPRVAAVLPAVHAEWFAARSRRPMLLRDLQALAVAPPPADSPARGPVLADPASAWGSMYVLEGSALGGQVIARALHSQLGLGPATGAAYFQGWGEATGTMWKQFRDRLELEIGDDAAAIARACRAAVATFDALADTFAMVLDERLAA